MKKILCILLSLLLVFALSFTVTANDSSTTTTFTTENGFSYTIVEYETENHQVVRQFQKADNIDEISVCSTSDGIEDTKAILASLGMEQEFIANLPDETLQDYSESVEITTITSYIKEDQYGNITYLTEDEVEIALQSIDYSGASDTQTPDSYMTITHTVSYQNNALYLFSTSATWLRMPLIRSTDSIGSCAPTLAIDNDTRYAWCSYTETNTNLTNGSYSSATRRIYPTDYRNGYTSDWYGSVSVFSLPSDITTDTYAIQCSNFKAYFQFKAYLRYPDSATIFNSIGTYTHVEYIPSASLSVEINTDGEVTASIGLSGEQNLTRRSVELLLHYDPDIMVLSIEEN